MKECIKCDDTGFVFPECETCGRKGWVEDPKYGGTMTCPECEGDAEERCVKCDGSGQF